MITEELCSLLIRSPQGQKEFYKYAYLYQEELAKFKVEKEKEKEKQLHNDTVGKGNGKIKDSFKELEIPNLNQNDDIIINSNHNKNSDEKLYQNTNNDVNLGPKRNKFDLNLKNQFKNKLNQKLNSTNNQGLVNEEYCEKDENSTNEETIKSNKEGIISHFKNLKNLKKVKNYGNYENNNNKNTESKAFQKVNINHINEFPNCKRIVPKSNLKST